MGRPRSYESKYQPPPEAAILAIPILVLLFAGMYATTVLVNWGYPTLAAVVFTMAIAFGVVAVAIIGFLITAPICRYIVDSYRYSRAN